MNLSSELQTFISSCLLDTPLDTPLTPQTPHIKAVCHPDHFCFSSAWLQKWPHTYLSQNPEITLCFCLNFAPFLPHLILKSCFISVTSTSPSALLSSVPDSRLLCPGLPSFTVGLCFQLSSSVFLHTAVKGDLSCTNPV